MKKCRRSEYGGKKFDDVSVIYDETIRISIAAAAAAASIPRCKEVEVGRWPGSRFLFCPNVTFFHWRSKTIQILTPALPDTGYNTF